MSGKRLKCLPDMAQESGNWGKTGQCSYHEHEHMSQTFCVK